jgi:O-antigen/teichoic acid export membrane protein
MEDQSSKYRQIVKATSIFGGVQVFSIIISIVRSKFIAVLLGPLGMGISGLLTSTTGFVASLTEFGLGTSAVKNISTASTTHDYDRIYLVSSVLRRLVWITGLLGTLVTLVSAPLLSRITFGDERYTIAFVWISITLLFTQLTFGQMAILQGLRKLQYLAKANMAGSLVGLFVSVPIYFLWGIDGIVPAIIVSSILALAISSYFIAKLKIKKVPVNRTILRTEGGDMLKMGFLLSISGLMTIGASYVLRIFISQLGGIALVGLYSAGFSIVNTYVGMIFNAMGTDYYPRLAEIANDNVASRKAINQQAEVAILVLAPILVFFLVFIKVIIILLYSNKFVEINGMIHWAALGMFFKGASWPIGIVFLAKGATKTFFLSEFAANIYMLIFNLIMFRYFKLNGLGFSFMVGYFVLLIQVYLIAKTKYSFSFGIAFYKIFCIQFILGLLSFVTIKSMIEPYNYFVGLTLLFLSVTYSYGELDKRIGLKLIILNTKDKFLYNLKIKRKKY